MKRNPAAWTMLYHGWFDADISDPAKLTLWAIYSFYNHQANEWYEVPTVERVAQLRKLSTRIVKDHYKELEAAQLIRRRRVPLIGGGSVLEVEIIEPSRHKPVYKEPISEGADNFPLGDSEGEQNFPLTKGNKTTPSINTKTNTKRTLLESNDSRESITHTHAHEDRFSSRPLSNPRPAELSPKLRAVISRRFFSQESQIAAWVELNDWNHDATAHALSKLNNNYTTVSLNLLKRLMLDPDVLAIAGLTIASTGKTIAVGSVEHKEDSARAEEEMLGRTAKLFKDAIERKRREGTLK